VSEPDVKTSLVASTDWLAVCVELGGDEAARLYKAAVNVDAGLTPQGAPL